MTKKDMNNIQLAAWALTAVIRNTIDCEPYEAPQYIQDAFYGANALWLTLQEMIEKKEELI